MKKTLPTLLLALAIAVPAWSQEPSITESLIEPLSPYGDLVVGVGLDEPLSSLLGPGRSDTSQSNESDYLGRLSTNPYLPDSTSNRFGRYGSRYSSDSINNRFGRYGSRFSPNSVTNPFATETPKVFGSDGKYLGKLSTNPFDPESIANPFGRFGSEFSPESINNPFGDYGSPFSPCTAPGSLDTHLCYAAWRSSNSSRASIGV